jgi:hypothetical protein
LRCLAIACFAAILSGRILGAEQGAAPGDSDYLARLKVAERELDVLRVEAGPANTEARRSALSRAMQNLAAVRSQVGDHAGALEAYASMQSQFGGSNDSNVTADASQEYAQSTFAKFTPEPAIAAIARVARDRQIVILNEAHHVPRHRAFAVRLALELRKQGFEYLAMETLAPDVGSLERRGHPTVADGYYSDEPLFGDFIRQALRAGYRPVAYEQGVIDASAPADWIDRIESREEAQANNLIERVLKREPRARLLVYVGYSHAFKGFQEMPGNRRTAWMAERLRSKTGIDPLCIDQTTVIEPRPGSRDRALHDAIFAVRADDSVVLAARDAPTRFMSPDAARIDLQVFHRPSSLMKGRPDWLAMGGYRKPHRIPARLLPDEGRRLIQAFVAGESPDAIPIDQVLVTAGEPPPVLMLPDVRIRFAYQD